MANVFTRPLYTVPSPIPTDLVEAKAVLLAKQNLAKILSTKTITDVPLAVGDLVDVYVRTDGQKRATFYSPQSVLELY